MRIAKTRESPHIRHFRNTLAEKLDSIQSKASRLTKKALSQLKNTYPTQAHATKVVIEPESDEIKRIRELMNK